MMVQKQKQFLNLFAQDLRSEAPLLERLALMIGAIEEPDISIPAYLTQINELADLLCPELARCQTNQARAWTLLHVLHDKAGFTGNQTAYYSPSNSFLHKVLENRQGLPITLSVLYMAAARRCGCHLVGMGFPGHFMLLLPSTDIHSAESAISKSGIADSEMTDSKITESEITESEPIYIDPFYRDVVTEPDLVPYLTQLFQQPMPLQQPLSIYRTSLNPILTRVLNNLRIVYLNSGSYAKAARVLNFMVLIAPEDPALWRERGAIRFQQDRLLEAESDLRRYFYLTDQLHEFVESRPVAHLQPAIVDLNPQEREFSRHDLETLALVDEIRRLVARRN